MNYILIILVSPVTFLLMLMGRFPKAISIPDTVAFDQSLPHLEINGTVLHLETFGDPTHQPLIVLHGGPGNDYRYLRHLKVLQDNFFVIMYDQRGTGLSKRVHKSELSAEKLLKDLTLIIEYFAPDRKVSIIGHSWGAMLASYYLRNHTHKVEKIVLAEPGFLTNDQAKIFIEQTKAGPNWSVLKLFFKAWYESLFVRGKGNQLQGDYFFSRFAGTFDIDNHPLAGYFNPEKLKDFSMPMWRFNLQSPIAIKKHTLDANKQINVDFVSGVENFEGEVLFISSEYNTIIGTEYQKEHLKYFKNAHLVEIKDAGHMMFSDNEKESLKVLRDYLEA